MTTTCLHAVRFMRPARAAQAWGECVLEEFLGAFRCYTTGFLSGHEEGLFFGNVSMHMMKLSFFVGTFSARTCI